MKYRVTCLTPTLVGDGQRLSPIDYMVWKDQVNILDQRRIFRLLARGPRLDGYLNQLRKAEKLDFASWGGFAQNYAGRRIPFEHASLTQHWEKARAENLFIPTFASGPAGPFLPGSALKGALRTGAVHAQWSSRGMSAIAEKLKDEDPRALRRATAPAEDSALGAGGGNIMKVVAAADSATVPITGFRVYLLRVSTLESKAAGKLELAWKMGPRGGTKRVEESTPWFAEMADPGSVFEGVWTESQFLTQPEIVRYLRRKDVPVRETLFATANAYAAEQLAAHKQYAQWAGLGQLETSVSALQQKLEDARSSGTGCLVNIGWGGGFLSKAAFLNTTDSSYRQILKQVSVYARAIQSGLPFPKTRRIVFANNQPATLPGWVLLDVA